MTEAPVPGTSAAKSASRFVAVVVPAWNERENVEALVERIDRALAPRRGRREILFVAAGDDGTPEVLLALVERVPDLRVLSENPPAGLPAAYRRGFAALPPEVTAVVTMDADLNHQPEEIERLLAALDAGADVVVGSRTVAGAVVEGTPRWKRRAGAIVNAALTRLGGGPVGDKTSGFRAYRRAALDRLEIRLDGFPFVADLLLQAQAFGFTIVEVPIRFVYRTAGRSKLPFVATSFAYLAFLAGRLRERAFGARKPAVSPARPAREGRSAAGPGC